MQVLEPKTALGLYAGASAVHINACILKTDGLDILNEPVSLTRSYSAELREQLLHMSYPDDFTDSARLKDVNQKITEEHLNVARELLDQENRRLSNVQIMGYSGHPIHIRSADKAGVYLGDGDVLAKQLGIPVVDRFAQTDLQAGGVGGPLLSTFLEAVTRAQPKPLAIISLSGVTSLTYIGALGQQYAFDVGVGCLLLDRWVQRHTGAEADFDGLLAERGKINQRLLDYLLRTDYLLQKPPKTLDREDFDGLLAQVEGCSPADGAATLTAFIVRCIEQAAVFLSEKPVKWILTGGGTLNPALVLRLKKALPGEVVTMTDMKMPHYNLDAAGYAFLAVRSLMRLPITFPETTGVAQPSSGGVYHAINPA